MIQEIAIAVFFCLACAEAWGPACLGVLVHDLWRCTVRDGGDRLRSDGSRFGRGEVILVRSAVILA
jgi:hypothetical protein